MAASENPSLRLKHIRDEIVQLRVALTGVSFDDFVGSYVLKRTTERALLIVSEAVRALPRELTDRHTDIPWAAIRAIGNVLRHEYSTVDPRILWHVAIHDLPNLAPTVDLLLTELSVER